MKLDVTLSLPPWPLDAGEIVAVRVTVRVDARDVCHVPASGEPDPRRLADGVATWAARAFPDGRLLGFDVN